jgi:hypothetical protein
MMRDLARRDVDFPDLNALKFTLIVRQDTDVVTFFKQVLYDFMHHPFSAGVLFGRVAMYKYEYFHKSMYK